MYLDSQLLFSKNQKITQTAVSDKTVNAGDCGSSLPVYPLVQVTEGFEGLTALTVHIQAADKESPEEEDWHTIMSSKKYAAEEVQKPCTVSFGSLPPETGKILRVRYEAEGTASKGAVTAALVLDRQS